MRLTRRASCIIGGVFQVEGRCTPNKGGRITVRQIITKGLASIYTDVPTLRPGTVEAYALAFASAGVATVVRLAIDPSVMGAEGLPFFPAVIITALIGGKGAGPFCLGRGSTPAGVLPHAPPSLLPIAMPV